MLKSDLRTLRFIGYVVQISLSDMACVRACILQKHFFFKCKGNLYSSAMIQWSVLNSLRTIYGLQAKPMSIQQDIPPVSILPAL